MDKHSKTEYQPDYAVVPGEVLADFLEARGMTQHQLSQRTGLTPKHIGCVIQGKSPITPDTAIKFQRTLGKPVQFWLNLESRYQEVTARLKEESRLDTYASWLSKIPVAPMVKLGWISKHKDVRDQLVELFCFFAIAGVDQWDEVWSSLKESNKRRPVSKTSAESLSAWLRRGEIEAADIACDRYDRNKFRQGLGSLRKLTATPSDALIPKLQEISAKWGVALVLIPTLPKMDVLSACRWLNPNKALIQLSPKFKTEDEMWLAFFHAAAHILLHSKKELFLSVPNLSEDGTEREASEFASNAAIPRKDMLTFIDRAKFDRASVREFASELQVGEGIVVAQLQQRGLISKAALNDLRRPFRPNQRAGSDIVLRPGLSNAVAKVEGEMAPA